MGNVGNGEKIKPLLTLVDEMSLQNIKENTKTPVIIAMYQSLLKAKNE